MYVYSVSSACFEKVEPQQMQGDRQSAIVHSRDDHIPCLYECIYCVKGFERLNSIKAQLRMSEKRPSIYKVQKFIGKFPNLIHDGTKLICKVCDNTFVFRNKFECKQHVHSTAHENKKAVRLNRLCAMYRLISQSINFCTLFNNKESNWRLPTQLGNFTKNYKSSAR